MTDQHKDDAMLEQYLEGKSGLTKEYEKQEKHQPAAELDDMILSAARDAINEKGKKPEGGKKTWLIPTAIAATVVLSFSLIQLQKPPMLYQPQEKEMDMAAVEESPQKPVLAKKKEQRLKPEMKATPLLEEQLAAVPQPEQPPVISQAAPAPVVSGIMMEPETKLARRSLDSQRMTTMADTEVVLSRSQWLEKIKQLLKENKVDEAKKEYQRFIKRYPDFVADAELKQQLELKP